MLCIGPFRHASVDSAVHGPVRLGVLNALQTQGALDFTTLRKRLEVADGALGLRLGKLDEIGYVKAIGEYKATRNLCRRKLEIAQT